MRPTRRFLRWGEGKSVIVYDYHMMDTTIRLIEVETGKIIRWWVSPDKTPIYKLQIASDGKSFIAIRPRSIQIWSMDRDEPVRTIAIRGEGDPAHAISPDLQWLLFTTPNDPEVRLLHLKTGKIHGTYRLHHAAIARHGFSPTPACRHQHDRTQRGLRSRNATGMLDERRTVATTRKDRPWKPLSPGSAVSPATPPAPTGASWSTLRPLVARLARPRRRPASDRDDLVQEVLVVVVRRVSEFEHRGRGAFRAWLRGILANHTKKFFRTRADAPAVDLDAIADRRACWAPVGSRTR